MRIEPTPVHCIACKHEWLAETVTEAPVEIWAASVKAIRCPTCGATAKNVAFGRGDVPDPQPVQGGMTDSDKRAAWLKMHDYGLSSECIADKMCGMAPTGNYPHDGIDFGRCERLLILYPEWRGRLGEMREVNLYWSALVDSWSEITEAWRHDVELRRRDPHVKEGWRCYALMNSILDPLEQRTRTA